jgi:hypothetical protein
MLLFKPFSEFIFLNSLVGLADKLLQNFKGLMPVSSLDNEVADLMKGILNILAIFFIVHTLEVLGHQTSQLRDPHLNKVLFAAQRQMDLVQEWVIHNFEQVLR